MRKEQEQPAVTIQLPRDLHIFLNRVAGTGSLVALAPGRRNRPYVKADPIHGCLRPSPTKAGKRGNSTDKQWRGLPHPDKHSFANARVFDKEGTAYRPPFERTVIYLRSRPWDEDDNR